MDVSLYHVFFEDDVFFYNEQTLLNIDIHYPNCDLLSNTYTENILGNKNTWHWSKITIQFPPPYYSAMVCSVRMSKLLLSKIKEYALKYKTLFFLEALFPTICMKYKLTHCSPIEFSNIVYRYNYTIHDINKLYLYHPLKNIKSHLLFRKYYK